MSAHVFKEEVRQYLDAGMDGFLGKPIDPVRLNTVIYQVVYENDKPISLPASRNSIEQETSCRDALMKDVRVIGLDKTRELVELFFDTSLQTLDNLKINIQQKDNSAIGENAHKLKGAASSVGLNLLYKCAMEIETSAHQQKGGIQQPFEHLRLVYQESCHLLKRVFEGISQQQKAS
jgi:HPt (histidine-containing phosphotransfer) domain-containing protein